MSEVECGANWIVVLTWNGRQDTLDLLAGLTSSPADGTRVLVVDNGSIDGTLDAVKNMYPQVETLQTGENLGYAGGNNRGVELAIERGARTVCVLNNDTLVVPGFLAPLVAAVENDDVAVSPDIRYQGVDDVSWFRGGKIDHDLGIPRHLQAGEQNIGSEPFGTELLTGCCIVASSATWRRVGGFDERFFLIFEDSDWSMRARQRGVALKVIPQSQIVHKGSRSFRGYSQTLGHYYYARNGLEFARRWLTLQDGYRFLKRSVLPQVTGSLRARSWRRALNSGIFAMGGILAFVARRFGRAGEWWTGLARSVT